MCPDLLHPVQSFAVTPRGVAAEVGRVFGHGDDRGHGPAADEGVPQAGMWRGSGRSGNGSAPRCGASEPS